MSENLGLETAKVLVLVGDGRCGSTVIDRCLGTAEGFTSCNELYRFFHRVIIEKGMCTCGEVYNDCQFYSKAAAAIGDKKRMADLQYRIVRAKFYFRFWAFRWLGASDSDLKFLIENTNNFYREIFKVSGGVIVDSSKSPTHALLLGLCPDLDVKVLHVTRSLRDTIGSWKTPKYDQGIGREMKTFSAVRTSLVWVYRYFLCVILKRKFDYAHLSYEDFLGDPQFNIDAIFSKLYNLDQRVVFFSDKIVETQKFHSVSGNPDRHSKGLIEISERKSKYSLKFYEYIIERVSVFSVSILIFFMGEK